jgi:branched-chain amino acid transport system ATP-binding protein
MTTLELENVAVARSGGIVIEGVSFTVEEGTITSLVGSNGAGKTSLLESISGVVPVARGRIRLGDQDITRASRRGRALRGLVHVEQGRAVFPSLTVRENIRLALAPGTTLDEAIASFPELERRLDSPTALLSGGEQQMVVIARALAARPRVLLVDEMSLGLAPVIFARLLPVISDIAARGVAVLLVEQFAQQALAIANGALVVAGGHLTYRGPASNLVANPELLVSSYLG